MKLFKKFDLTPQKIIPASIAIIIASVIIMIGYYFGIELVTGVPMTKDWIEKDVTLENLLNDADASEEASLNMMLSHLKVIAKDRHTTNSEEIGTVREYLCKQFEIMGYEYEIIEDTYEGKELAVLDMQHHLGLSKEDAQDEKERKSGTFKHFYSEHYKENYEGEEILPTKHLLVKVIPENISNEKAVLVMCHYDSVRSSTNAANGGMSTASILEAMRLLQNKELVRPIYFWFSDGEEISLLGAETLLNDRTELADSVEYVLNFTGYGPEGNQFLIATNKYNSAMLQHFKNANTKIAAYSLFSNGSDKWGTDEYRNVLKPVGFQGLDFAAIVDANEYYNTMHDSVENLNRNYANTALHNITTLIIYCATTNTNNITLSDGTTADSVITDRDTILFTLPFFKQVTVPAKQLQIAHFIIIIVFILLVVILQKLTNDTKPESNPSEFTAYIGGGLLTVILSAYIADLLTANFISWTIRGYILIPVSFTMLYIVTKALGFKKGEVGTFWCLFVFLGALSVITTLCIPELSYLFVAAFILLNIMELFIAYTKGVIRTILVLLIIIPGGAYVTALFTTWQVIAYATVGLTLFGALFLILMPAFGVIYHGVNAAVKSVCKEEFRPNLNPTGPDA